MSTYYHYSDKEGLKGIVSSKMIQMSTYGRYGSGVYLTTMAPAYGRLKVSRNNWDGMAINAEMQGKTDYCISVTLDERDVQRFQGTDGTDIYLYKGHIYLNQTNWKLYSKNGDHYSLVESGWWCTIL